MSAMSEAQSFIFNDDTNGLERRKAKSLIDPRFDPYLKNNDLPSSHILDALVASKFEPSMRLQSVERDIQALELVLDTLQRRRAYFEDVLSVYDSILAPIRRLPDDTLEEIFVHCIPTTRNARPFVSESPLLLTLVCKKWRRISFAAPRLWSSLHIPIIFDYDPMSSQFDPIYFQHGMLKPPASSEAMISDLQKARSIGLNQWLTRSGTLPISLSLHFSSSFSSVSAFSHYSSHRLMQQETFSLVARYSDRLLALQMTMPEHICKDLGGFLKNHIGPRGLPRLRQLRVSASAIYEPRYEEDPRQLSVFFDAASLQEISLELPVGDLRKAVDCFTSNVTTLSLHTSIEASFVQHILRKCHKLEQAHITVNNMSARNIIGQTTALNTVPDRTTAIWLPALRTLSISGALVNIQTTCEILETPLLSNLQLYVSKPHHQADSQQESDLPYPPHSTVNLCLFLSKCTSLHSLTIEPTYIRAAEIQAILSNVPHVEDLVLDNHFSARPGMSIAIAKIGPGSPCLSTLRYHLHPLLDQASIITGERVPIEEPLLPCLTSLTWNQFSYDLIPDDLLITFINSRLSPPIDTDISSDTRLSHQRQSMAPLKNVKLRFLFEANAHYVEAEIARRAELTGLKRGIDFALDVSVFPWVKQHLTPMPQYIIPKVFLDPLEVHYSQDNLMIEYDVTWSIIDI